MKHVKEIMTAYSDCNGFSGERNLAFFCQTPLTAEELKTLFPALVPEGYNAFDPVKSVAKMIEVFGEKSEYFVAREGSVCIYVKHLHGNLWFDRVELDADEFLFCPEKQLFRVWWD